MTFSSLVTDEFNSLMNYENCKVLSNLMHHFQKPLCGQFQGQNSKFEYEKMSIFNQKYFSNSLFDAKSQDTPARK